VAAHRAREERRRMRRIGFLMGTSETDLNEQSSVAAFVQTLERLGWVAGKNIEIEYRWTAGDPRRMQEYAQELVALSPDVIFAKGAAAPPVTQATTTIPVVFAVLSDMLAQRYVKNFARPDRNVTGFASDEITLVSKRVEILKEISPSLTRVLYVRGRETRSPRAVSAVGRRCGAIGARCHRMRSRE
jgi:putative tryptophan/tyrosine transport system substrate-binding protein